MKKFPLLPLILAIVLFLIYPFRIIQFISIAIIIIYIQAFITSFIQARSFSVKRERDVTYCKNDEDEYVTLLITNESPFGLQNIKIEDKGSGCYKSGTGEFLRSFSPGETLQVKTKIDQEKRGQYKTGPVIIRGADPLRLFPWSVILECPSDIIVYPKITPLELLFKRGEREGGIKVNDPVYLDPNELRGIREYRKGDSLKNINWKISARSGKLQVMEFSNTINTPLFIVLDLDPKNYPTKYRYYYIEKSIEAASSLIYKFSMKNQPIGLYISYGDEGELWPLHPGYGYSISLLEKLATIDPGNGNGREALNSFMMSNYNLPQGTSFYLISPMTDEKIIPHLELLKRKRVFINSVFSGDGNPLKPLPGYVKKFYLNINNKELLNVV